MIDKKAQYATQDNWDRNNTTRITIKLNNNTDAEIIEWLEKQDSKQGAIKKALKEYLEGCK